uniref:Uncharacterized protein n=1 Tax=Lactuca sativa TaxID=4236 RepID=A0A9R1VDR0_LACSA|nr:hypothetical protein LSAT_V11C500273650 [Lactuca sativa]
MFFKIPNVGFKDFEGISEDEAQQELSEGDDEDKLQSLYTTHDPKVKWNSMKPVCEERCESPHQLKLCLTNYSITRGYPIRFKKGDSVRFVVVCESDPEKFPCPYVRHTCVRNFHSANLLDLIWIARQFLKEMVRKPNLKCKKMQAIIQSRFHCKVSWSKCYRAKCREISLIDRNFK